MPKTAAINMRVDPDQRALLDRAAALLHMDRSVFIMNAACRDAENVLLDQRLFALDADTFNSFAAALDAPLPDPGRLKALLSESSPWDEPTQWDEATQWD